MALFAIVLLFAAYTLFFRGDEEEAGLTTGSGTAAGTLSSNTVGSDLIKLLKDLNAIELDQSIFDEPSFQSLKDFSRPLRAEPVGRENPFAPLSASARTKNE